MKNYIKIWGLSFSVAFIATLIFVQGVLAGTLSDVNEKSNNPSIAGRLVAWEANDGRRLGLYDLTQKRNAQILGRTDILRKNPDVSGNYVVYNIIEEFTGKNGIYICEYSDGNCYEGFIFSQAMNVGAPNIYGRHIVWGAAGMSQGVFAIHLCEYLNGSCTGGVKLLAEVSSDKMPEVAVSGNLVVWSDSEGVKLINLRNREEIILIRENHPATVYYSPKISGTTVAWGFNTQATLSGVMSCVYDVDMKTCEDLKNVSGTESEIIHSLDVSGKVLYWEQDKVGADIRKIFRLGFEDGMDTSLLASGSGPSVSGNTIVFENPESSSIESLKDDSFQVSYFGDPKNQVYNDCPGNIQIGVNTIPRAGDDSFSIYATGAAPNQNGMLIIGNPNFGGENFGDAKLFVNFDESAQTFSVTTDAGGNAEILVPLSNNVEGDVFYAQYLVFNGEECGYEPMSGSMSASDAVEVVVKAQLVVETPPDDPIDDKDKKDKKDKKNKKNKKDKKGKDKKYLKQDCRKHLVPGLNLKSKVKKGHPVFEKADKLKDAFQDKKAKLDNKLADVKSGKKNK